MRHSACFAWLYLLDNTRVVAFVHARTCARAYIGDGVSLYTDIDMDVDFDRDRDTQTSRQRPRQRDSDSDAYTHIHTNTPVQLITCLWRPSRLIQRINYGNVVLHREPHVTSKSDGYL